MSGQKRGEAHHEAKLDWAKVREIRRLVASRCPTCRAVVKQADIAPRFGVSLVLIHKDVHNRGWLREHDPLNEVPAGVLHP